MSNIYKNVIELIGKTPLVEVENVEKRFKHHCLLLTSYRSAIAVYDAYVGRRVDEPSRDRRMIRPDINSLVLLPCVQNCFCGFHL